MNPLSFERIGVLDHGHVDLVAFCADDLAVVNGARVSLNAETDEMTEKDHGLIKFLMRERHGSPFEHGYFRFRVKAPLFVFREWHRHRAGHSYNEWSARYSKLEPEFYVPSKILTQKGKPGAYTFEEMDANISDDARTQIEDTCEESFATYEYLLSMGVSKQQARIVLPVNTYSEMIWSCNPRSLMHFLSLRDHEAAQYEIREYAKVIARYFESVMPVTYQAFIENGRRSP